MLTLSTLNKHLPLKLSPIYKHAIIRSRQTPAEDVEGRTQLERGYMPIRELIGFYPSREEVTIDASAGSFPIGG